MPYRSAQGQYYSYAKKINVPAGDFDAYRVVGPLIAHKRCVNLASSVSSQVSALADLEESYTDRRTIGNNVGQKVTLETLESH